jgi:hypothetical protein
MRNDMQNNQRLVVAIVSYQTQPSCSFVITQLFACTAKRRRFWQPAWLQKVVVMAATI